MTAGFWRWITALLLLANIVLVVLFIRGDLTETVAQPAIPSLDPALPRLVLLDPDTRSINGEPVEFDCFSIGPLNSLLAQQRAEDRLRATSLRLQSRQTRSEHDRGWWVYLPAGSRSDALDLTRSLAESGLEDFFVVTRGEMENVVSVGLYENIDNARARQRQVRAAGFNAQLEIRRESVPQFWVDYQPEPGVESAWRFIVDASPGARHRPIPCFDDHEDEP